MIRTLVRRKKGGLPIRQLWRTKKGGRRCRLMIGAGTGAVGMDWTEWTTKKRGAGLVDLVVKVDGLPPFEDGALARFRRFAGVGSDRSDNQKRGAGLMKAPRRSEGPDGAPVRGV